MTNLMLCLGRQATHPYDLETLNVRVYSIEELCFYIVRNRYLIGTDVFTPSLFDWVENECGLEELAIGLRRRYDAKSNALDYATLILEYVRYNTQEEITETRRILKDSTDMDIYEKHLARADFLIESEHYHQAMDVYAGLRRMTPEEDRKKQARILMGEGDMNARTFSFAQAAECFREAYELTHETEAYLRYLAALRMRMTEKEYLDFIASDEKGYQLSMSLESEISAAEDGYTKSAGFEKVKRLKALKSEGKMNEYYALSQEIIEELKRAYRGTVDVVVKK